MVREKKIKSQNNKFKNISSLLMLLAIIILVNFIGSRVFKRFDLTSEKRYTLAESTRTLLSGINDELYVKIYLEGDFNASFARLKNETREILDEFRSYANNRIQYEFITPGEGLTPEETQGIEKQLYEKGIIPEEVTERKKDKTLQTRIWPGAILSYKGKEAAWQIFQRQDVSISPEENVNNSIEELEYSLTNTIRKLLRDKKLEVTFIQGHGEVDTLHQYRFMQALEEYYKVNQTVISGKLKALEGSDAIVISQPDSTFNDKDKYIIDQYIMNGGKVLWLIDPMDVNRDSLRKGYTIGINRPLNIEDMLFKYGVRLNPVLVQDLQCGKIGINTAFRGQPKIELFSWLYSPVVTTENTHPIVKNLDAIKFDFLSTLDTISSARGIKKTILLSTSRYTKTQPSPVRIALGMIRIPAKESQFINSYQPIACLLEGEFSSFVEYRIPSRLLNDSTFKYIDKGKKTKMIVVADGDLVKNDFLSTGEIPPLGYDRFTRQIFANRTFLLNCINYLLDDEGMLQLRSREVKLRLLDVKKINQHRSKWQLVNVLLPLLFVIVFAATRFYLRKKKYAGSSTKE